MKYDKNAVTLIKQAPAKLLPNPCRQCEAQYNGSCCGCPKHRKYKAVIDEYNKAGTDVLETARFYKKYVKAKKDMEYARRQLIDKGFTDFMD